MSFKVDLHLHSYNSDGSDSPKEIIEMASKLGLSAISITDHDHFTCTPKLIAYAKKLGVELIPGIELSCFESTTGRKVHLLAYFCDTSHPHIDHLIQTFKEKATKTRLNMVEAINQSEIDLKVEEVLAFSHGMIYKQHIALALEKKGYGKYTELYSHYFRGKTSLEKQFPTAFIPIKDAIEAVKADGGISVLAHPRTYNTFDQIEKYISWGLEGIEISHPSYKENDLERVLYYPLLHTGGSDYHGNYNFSDLRQMGHFGISLEDFKKLKEKKYDVSN